MKVGSILTDTFRAEHRAPSDIVTGLNTEENMAYGMIEKQAICTTHNPAYDVVHSRRSVQTKAFNLICNV